MEIDAVQKQSAPESRGVRVTDTVVIPATELRVRATKSGGPGGQHVNTSSTRVEIVWNVRVTVALDGAQRSRVEQALALRLNARGAIRVVASDTRSQLQNRRLAEQRLAAMIRKALVVKAIRKRTKPHAGAVELRLAEKKLQSRKKRDRRLPEDD